MKSGHIEALSGHMEFILSFEITYNNTRFSLTELLLSNIIEIANSYIDVNEAFLQKKTNKYRMSETEKSSLAPINNEL